MVELGTVLGGKYRVDRVLGRGGMGVVAEVTHVQLGTTFAMKFLRSELAERQQVLDRFMREARAAAQLRGDHVCRVFDVSMIDGIPCLVMEKLEGTDLSHLLKQHGPLAIDVACEYLLQVCAGMAEAHAAGFIHRDLKPGNLFLTTRADGSPLIKILDFGVAKALSDMDHDLTHSGMILGSPSYMSPEQIKASRLASARSDLWSMGVILYELVSGAKPFKGDGMVGLAYNISMEPYPALPNIPPELDAVIARCLQKDPNLRFQSAGELAQALAPFSGRGSHPSVALASRLSGSNPSLGGRAATAPGAHEQPTVDGTQWTGQGSVGGTRWQPPPENSTIRGANGAIEGPAQRTRRLGFVIGGLACIGIGVVIAVVAAGGDDETAVSSSAAPAVTQPAAPAPPPADPPATAPIANPEPAAEPPPEPQTAATIDAGVPEPKPVGKPKPTKKHRKDVGESRI